MIVVICVDNHNGVAFNSRRQSRDKALSAWMLQRIADKPLWIENYSCSLFENQDSLTVVEDVLRDTPKVGFCFVERKCLADYKDEIERLIICKWNRDYPADEFLGIDVEGWKLETTQEIVGNSHETITIEEYTNEFTA